MQKTLDKQDEICYNDKVVRKNAGMAQSVEHVIGNDEVISSILITSSKKSFKISVEIFEWLFCFLADPCRAWRFPGFKRGTENSAGIFSPPFEKLS